MATHRSLRQFGIHMRGQAARIPGRSDAIVREIALAVDRTLVQATPVDEGRARANWQATLGAPATGTIDTGFAGAGQSGTQAGPIAQAAAVIAGYRGGSPGAAIFLTNNVPYIVPLNNGHSKQAPAGFIEKALDTIMRAARRARLIT